MIKLIASDIDGTLLTEGSDLINPEIFDVIKKMKEKDIIFAAASGRQYPSIRKLFASIAHDMIFIAENGAYVACRENDMSQVTMNKEDAIELIKEIRTMEGCHVTASIKDKMYIETDDEDFLDLLVNGYHNDMKVVKDILAENLDIIKISIYKKSGVADIADSAVKKWSPKFRTAVAGEIWIDFMDYEADKGNAILTIQKFLNITPEETMVFGDNLNDIGMIKSAVHSYAVGNARDEVKQAARYIADTNVNDGVLKVLKTLL